MHLQFDIIRRVFNFCKKLLFFVIFQNFSLFIYRTDRLLEEMNSALFSILVVIVFRCFFWNYIWRLICSYLLLYLYRLKGLKLFSNTKVSIPVRRFQLCFVRRVGDDKLGTCPNFVLGFSSMRQCTLDKRYAGIPVAPHPL